MSKRSEADRMIKTNVLWAVGSGLIPFPLADLAAVTAVQTSMIEKLAELYDQEYSHTLASSFVYALTGTGLAAIGASFIKAIPLVGTVIGGLSMSTAAGISTYAIGNAIVRRFEAGQGLTDVDMTQAKADYQTAYEEGKTVIAEWEKEEKSEAPADVIEALDQLGDLREKGIITDDEFDVQKKKLLERL